MGWICVSESCEGHIDASTGRWDGIGIAYYSIREEIFQIHERIFDFLAMIAPWQFFLIFMFFLIFFVIAMFVSVRKAYMEALSKG